MNSEEKEETDWALDALSSAISSFFERRVPGEEGKALANLAGELARQAGCGASYLTAAQAEEIFENWWELSAVGHDSGNLPLVRTKTRSFIFDVITNTRSRWLRHLASALLKKIAKAL